MRPIYIQTFRWDSGDPRSSSSLGSSVITLIGPRVLSSLSSKNHILIFG